MQERYPRAVLADGSTGNQKGANGQECLARDFGSAFDTYKISVYSGTGETIPVSLDDSNHQVREVRIVVDNPGQRSALLLNAYDPVVWKIARTQDSEIAGVFANGHHGQAVLGVEHKTPVIMSTKMYSPGSSCTPTEEFEALTALNAAPQGVVVNDGEVFFIGERPYQETSLIVSDERRLEDFSLRRIEVKEARPRSDR